MKKLCGKRRGNMKKLYVCAKCGYESFDNYDLREYLGKNYCSYCLCIPPAETADREVKDDYKPNCKNF
jgi:hypothetical protein